MNIVISCFDDKPEFIEAFHNIIIELQPENCYVFGYNSHTLEKLKELVSYERIPESVNIHFKQEYDFYNDNLVELNWSEYEPLDNSFIKEMSKLETEVYWMLTRSTYGEVTKHNKLLNDHRVNRFYDYEDLSYYRRKRMYLNYLRYWHNFYKKNNISILIEGWIPHIVWEYVGYKVAKYFNVKTVQFSVTPLRNTYLIIESYEHYQTSFIEEYDKILLENSSEDQIDFIFPETQTEWKRLTQSADVQELPYYEVTNRKFNLHLSWSQRLLQKDWNGLLKSKIWWKFQFDKLNVFTPSRLKYWDGWSFIIQGLNRSSLFEKKLFHFYERNCVKPNFNDKYFYYPLHFQPELTSSPLGGIFSDQLLVVQMLAACLPPDYKIYIKEHPMQRYKNRDIEFYQSLLIIPNVRFISRTENSYRLLENCFATVSLTGTAGWEGLFKGKPFLMFGNYYYKYIKQGIHNINSLSECKEAVKILLEEYPVIERKILKAFLKTFEVRGVRAGLFGSLLVDDEQESLIMTKTNLSKSFVKKIHQVLSYESNTQPDERLLERKI